MLKENYKITSELKNLIESKLWERWSLEQIIGRELNGKLSSKRILPKTGDELPEASLNSNLLSSSGITESIAKKSTRDVMV